MTNYTDERGTRRTTHTSEHAAGEEILFERAVGEARPLPTQESSLLRPQQNRHAVWRWHVRRRPSKG